MSLNFTIGVDEVGRGSWAGPIVAAAVLSNGSDLGKEFVDSKLLTESKRKDLATKIDRLCPWGIGIVDPRIIDRSGLSAANRLAFQRALTHLFRKVKIPPKTICLIDGNPVKLNSRGISSIKFLVKGESKSRAIAAASILAKNFRDSLMNWRSKAQPEWKWEEHKGYGTKFHAECLKKLGPIRGFHRLSYKPIQNILDQSQPPS